MSSLFVWPGVLVCALVIAGCICRLDTMRAGKHKAGWMLMYILYAPFALGVLIDLVKDRQVDWWACFGIAGILLDLYLTSRLWRYGAPFEVERCRP